MKKNQIKFPCYLTYPGGIKYFESETSDVYFIDNPIEAVSGDTIVVTDYYASYKDIYSGQELINKLSDPGLSDEYKVMDWDYYIREAENSGCSSLRKKMAKEWTAKGWNILHLGWGLPLQDEQFALSLASNYMRARYARHIGLQEIKLLSDYTDLPMPKNKYEIDGEGICEDGDIGLIRVRNVERDEIVKIKIGKLLQAELGDCIPETTLNFIKEVLTAKWIATRQAMSESIGGLHLVVDDDFNYIYNANNYHNHSDFGSCMTNEFRGEFYDNIEAMAASLRDDDGKVYARCIVYSNVMDEDTGEVFRLAERQYAKDKKGKYNTQLKWQLIVALQKEGYIDGYKSIMAGCGEATAFVLNNGTSLRDRRLSIDNTACGSSVCSYQDSFKWLNSRKHKAYNTDDFSYGYALDHTGYYVDEEYGEIYDEYEDRTY